MKKQVTGFCPSVGKDVTITVDYIYSSSFAEGELWVKNLISDCPSVKGTQCHVETCPIADLLPENIPF